MDQLQIVLFCQSPEPSESLRRLISFHPRSGCFQLPGTNELDLHQDKALQQALQLLPELVLVEITPGYDVEAFIRAYHQSYAEDMPTIVGVFDCDPDKAELDRVAELSIDSYLIMRWPTDKLKDRLAQLIRLRAYNVHLRDQIRDTSKTAMTAMKAASEVGLLMQLIEWLQSAKTHQEVSHCLLKLCRSLDLSAVLLILDSTVPLYFPEEMVSSSSRKLLNGVLSQGSRIVSKKRFMAFKLDQLVLLVTNAPWQDDDRYGRYRDILIQSAAIAEAKARTISINNLIVAQHEQVTSIMSLIKNLSGETQLYTRAIMRQLSERLALAALSLDLNEAQERELQALSTEAYEAIEILYKSSDALELHFHELVSSITKVKELTQTSALEELDSFADDDEVTLF